MCSWYFILLPVLPAAVMSASDFRGRSVSVPSVLAFILCSLVLSFLSRGVWVSLTRMVINLALLALFYVLLLGYFRIRYGKPCCIIDRAFGKGDALFLAGAASLLEPSPFCLFIAVSCLVGVIWARLSSSKEVPFVGLGVPVLFLFITISFFC